MITFRTITPDDMPMLHDWLRRPHVAEWWQPSPTLEEVIEDFRELAIPGHREQGYIAFEDGRPIGYIQSYVVMGAGGGWWRDEDDPGARGIDQFLANEHELGRGLGTAMVRSFVMKLFSDPAVTRIQTDPDPRNGRAIRCYQKSGFTVLKQVDTPDGPALLMFCNRPPVG